MAVNTPNMLLKSWGDAESQPAHSFEALPLQKRSLDGIAVDELHYHAPADADFVAKAKPLLGDALAVDEGAVTAVAILYPPRFAFVCETGVLAGNIGVGHADRATHAAAHRCGIAQDVHAAGRFTCQHDELRLRYLVRMRRKRGCRIAHMPPRQKNGRSRPCLRRNLDPHNPQNRNAGNTSDLIKHAVNAAFLETLLAHEPWKSGMRLHECHAGRGIYAIGADRARSVSALEGAAAARQAAVLARLGLSAPRWYAGSALQNALALGGGAHAHFAYEWDPDTRAVLVEAARGRFAIDVAAAGSAARFDGETYLGERIDDFDERDVIMLDPFGLWQRDKLAERRARYHKIIGRRPLPLSLFFVWSDHAGAESGDGYATLSALQRAPMIVVRWRRDLRCTMWLCIDEALFDPLTGRLAEALRPYPSVGVVRTASAGHGA